MAYHPREVHYRQLAGQPRDGVVAAEGAGIRLCISPAPYSLVPQWLYLDLVQLWCS